MFAIFSDRGLPFLSDLSLPFFLTEVCRFYLIEVCHFFCQIDICRFYLIEVYRLMACHWKPFTFLSSALGLQIQLNWAHSILA